ncbi:MAG: hypothetical protein ACR2PT_04185 [Endozoicomonas sp.]
MSVRCGSGRIDDQLGDIDTQLRGVTSEANALMKQLARPEQ